MSMTMKRLVTIACVIATASAAYALQLQDYVLSQSRPKSVPAMSQASDGEHYYRLSDDHDKIVKAEYKSGAETVLFDSKTARECHIAEWDGYAVSEDESRILLWTASEPIYRHSFRADYYVYEVRHNKLSKLTAEGGEEIATLSPDGRMVAYVKANNIRIKKLDYDTDVAVTTDGEVNKVINGVPDWVYQEELGMLSSLRFSPDNSILAFARWDESRVKSYTMTMYEGACNPKSEYSLYPGQFTFKYPVAGEENSVVTVHSYDIETRVVKQMQLPAEDAYYIQNITFGAQSSQLMVSTLNRTQNVFHIYSVNPRSCLAKAIYEEKSETWIDSDLASKVRFYDDFFVIPSDRSGFSQLYQYSMSGALLRQLTNGEENVTDFYGYDATKKRFYYQRTSSPLCRVVMAVDEKGKETALTSEDGTVSATFSATMAYFVRNYSNATTPNQYALYTAAGKHVRDLEMNKEYAARYTSPEVPRREFFTITSDGVSLNGYMIKPVDFDPSKKYPVIMTHYNGPGSQEVRNNWKMGWEQGFASAGYIIACVDSRGTGGRGKRFQDIVYMKLGRYETIDELAAAEYMAKLPYVDADRIGITGWSYGGFSTLMAMSQQGSKYAAGVAIAPVTSWRYYDSIYTERYMRTPRENAAGYKAASPLDIAQNLRGDLLLIFGSADDNVHIINSMQYAARLHEAGKMFDMMVYPNMNHSINGCDVRYPLYRKVLTYFDSKLK